MLADIAELIGGEQRFSPATHAPTQFSAEAMHGQVELANTPGIASTPYIPRFGEHV